MKYKVFLHLQYNLLSKHIMFIHRIRTSIKDLIPKKQKRPSGTTTATTDLVTYVPPSLTSGSGINSGSHWGPFRLQNRASNPPSLITESTTASRVNVAELEILRPTRSLDSSYCIHQDMVSKTLRT